MWKSACVGVYQLLNWKKHGETLNFTKRSISYISFYSTINVFTLSKFHLPKGYGALNFHLFSPDCKLMNTPLWSKCVFTFDAVYPDRQVPEFHRKMNPAVVLNIDAAGYSKTSLRVYSAARSHIPESTDFRIALKAQLINSMVNWHWDIWQ